MSNILYFAYGSNMSTLALRRKGLIPHSSELAELPDYDFSFDLRSSWLKVFGALATVYPKQGSKVHGVLHVLPERALKYIDLWEFVFIGLYERRRVLVRRQSGEHSWAEVYIGSERGLEAPPRPKYLSIILAGAVEFGLPSYWLDRLRNLSIHQQSFPEKMFDRD